MNCRICGGELEWPGPFVNADWRCKGCGLLYQEIKAANRAQLFQGENVCVIVGLPSRRRPYFLHAGEHYSNKTSNHDDGKQFAIPLLDAQERERQRVFDDLKKRAGWS